MKTMANKLDYEISYEAHKENISCTIGLLSLTFEEQKEIVKQVLIDLENDSKQYDDFNDYWNDQ